MAARRPVIAETSPANESQTDTKNPLTERFIQLTQPNRAKWPLMLNDPEIKAIAEDTLPQTILALASPVEPAGQEAVRAIFDSEQAPYRALWEFSQTDDGRYSFYCPPYESKQDGKHFLHSGIHYGFDKNGRLIEFAFVEGDWSYTRGQDNYRETFSYDVNGYLTTHTSWQYLGQPLAEDHFEYRYDENGDRVPAVMTRTIKVQGKDSQPMTVDLANWQEWLKDNPNGFRKVEKEALSPQPLEVKDYSVEERRRGIKFDYLEELEQALVMYGEGNYPLLAGETALEHNDRVFAEDSSFGGALFSAIMRAPDMTEFVRQEIMTDVLAKWKAIQKPWRKGDVVQSRFSFDYDGAGHFHKTGGDIEIAKDGLVLKMWAAYVGDQVEETLAAALDKKRGLRSASIKIPVNQSSKDGYFLVNVLAVCQKLNIPVTEPEVQAYFDQLKVYNQFSGQEKPLLWRDDNFGIKVELELANKDYDTEEDLRDYMEYDGTSIWGPLPKNIIDLQGSAKSTPRLIITVVPEGGPFDEETTAQTDRILRGYMTRLMPEQK